MKLHTPKRYPDEPWEQYKERRAFSNKRAREVETMGHWSRLTTHSQWRAARRKAIRAAGGIRQWKKQQIAAGLRAGGKLEKESRDLLAEQESNYVRGLGV